MNQKVTKTLNALLIKLTKSSPRYTNDNALVESKNGWIVRKWLGYSHISEENTPPGLMISISIVFMNI